MTEMQKWEWEDQVNSKDIRTVWIALGDQALVMSSTDGSTPWQQCVLARMSPPQACPADMHPNWEMHQWAHSGVPPSTRSQTVGDWGALERPHWKTSRFNVHECGMLETSLARTDCSPILDIPPVAGYWSLQHPLSSSWCQKSWQRWWRWFLWNWSSSSPQAYPEKVHPYLCFIVHNRSIIMTPSFSQSFLT